MGTLNTNSFSSSCKDCDLIIGYSTTVAGASSSSNPIYHHMRSGSSGAVYIGSLVEGGRGSRVDVVGLASSVKEDGVVLVVIVGNYV